MKLPSFGAPNNKLSTNQVPKNEYIWLQLGIVVLVLNVIRKVQSCLLYPIMNYGTGYLIIAAFQGIINFRMLEYSNLVFDYSIILVFDYSVISGSSNQFHNTWNKIDCQKVKEITYVTFLLRANAENSNIVSFIHLL